MFYLNLKVNGIVETIDEFETYTEANKMLSEYILASSYYYGLYISARSTREWREG